MIAMSKWHYFVLQHGKKELQQARGITPQDCQEHYSNGTKVKLKLAKLTLLKWDHQSGENDINNFQWVEILKELKKADKGEYIEVKLTTWQQWRHCERDNLI